MVARQLLAIDEEDRLVCYAVYPVTANAALLRAFQAYDAAMAQALGIELYRNQGDDEGHHVVEILARSWWDDGVWQETAPLPST